MESSRRHRRGFHRHAVAGQEAGRAGRQQCHRPAQPWPPPGAPSLPAPRSPAAPRARRAPAPPPGAPAAGGRTAVRGDKGNKRTRSEKGIKEGNVANTKNKRRNFPRGKERGKRHLNELFFFFFPPYNFCRNSDNARARFPFPSPHKPVVVLLSLFHFIVLEMLNHKTGVSENGIYLTEISPTLF